MKKSWSITTTTRNPYRLRAQLRILKDNFIGNEWTAETQAAFQILLIQHRLYGYNGEQGFSNQFLIGLPDRYKEIFIDSSRDLKFNEARKIFESKKYTDPPMRGRQSFNPFKKFGFVRLEKGILRMTDCGEYFLSDDYDLSYIFFRVFIKWQKYDIKPFIGTLHLINAVNKKEISLGKEPKGISKEEFSLFAPTLVHYQDIEKQAEKIIVLRAKLFGKNQDEQKSILKEYKNKFARKFLESTKQSSITKLLNNLKDYGDNAIRYFRLTKYIHIRGGGFYIDLEKRRSVEIESLLSFDNAQPELFDSPQAYIDYISDTSQPQLPWETKEKYIEIIEKLTEEIQKYENRLQKKNVSIKDYQEMQNGALKNYITELRTYRQQLQNEENYEKSQGVEQIKSYIQDLKNIYDFNNRPILLEKLSTLGLHAINDALKVKPNYPVGDDNEPTFTAPANTPDIECFYKNFNAICEVTMLKSRDQWYNEGQPVMRHLRDFENKYSDKKTYCLFIAPSLHRDTLNTFWTAIKYEYEGKKQKIIPLTINNFVLILQILVQIKIKKKFLKHSEISRLYDEILDSSSSFNDSNKWIQNIPNIISLWQENICL